jgi:rhamnogalacturonan endolyase
MRPAEAEVSRRTALGLLGTAAAATAAAAWPAAAGAAARPGSGAAATGEVTLVDDGASVTLANGLVSATVMKDTAQIRDLRLVGSAHGNEAFNLVSGANGQGYTTFDYYVGTTRFSVGLSGAAYRVVQQTADRVEVAMSQSDPARLPFAVEVHIAVERGLPGLYVYLVFGYPAGMPALLTIQQLRYAVAAGDPSFTYFVVDDARGVQQRPSIEDMRQAVTLQDTTYLLPGDRVYSKYQNISDQEGDNHVFMVSNGSLGMAVVQANKDWFAGGPTKQELTCHDYFNGEILLWHPFTSHYGSPDLEPPVGWEKVFGPFYLHVTEAAGAEPAANVAQMWADAKRAAARERAKWPYAWVGDPRYAAGERSTVRGKLSIAGQARPAGAAASSSANATAWVVLSQDQPDRVYQGIPLDGRDWQYHNLGYVYYARTGHGGHFAVPAVRPGTYRLTAFADGVLGKVSTTGIEVQPSTTVDIGNHVLRTDDHGVTLWQIGRPNRSAAESHVYGGPSGFRQYLAWLEYPYEFPDGVDFRVGVDDVAQKWNYFQPCYRTPGTPLQLQLRGTTQDRSLTRWRIRFDSKGFRKGLATLDIALAASVFGTLQVSVNGTTVASFDPLPGPAGDNSSYRLASRGMYRRLPPIQFDAALIRRGANTVDLSPVRPPVAPLTRGNTVDNWMEPMAGVMYDVIRLQVKPG